MTDTGIFADVIVMRRGHPLGAAMDKHSSRMGDSSWRSNHLGQHVDPDVTAVKANDTIPNLNQHIECNGEDHE